jgi:glycosyltransferase involved in cell wall biosynthesis
MDKKIKRKIIMLSIIMSVYNNEKTLSLAINSILNQTYKEFKFIIVDDCSTDNSVEIIQEYQKQDSRIVLIKNESNLGLPKSLNKAIEVSKYDYIARIDGDDICMLDRFEKQMAYIKSNPHIDILGTGAILIDQQGIDVGKVLMPESDEEIKKAIRYKNPMIHPSIIMKKSVLEELSGYDENLRKAQDLDLWSRAVDSGKVFYNMQEYLIKYRIDLDKSYSTIFKGFKVSFLKAFYNKSLIGALWSLLELFKYILIKQKLYKPRSMRK